MVRLVWPATCVGQAALPATPFCQWPGNQRISPPLKKTLGMNIDRFKQEHVEILASIALLRRLTQAGVAHNAEPIAQAIVSMSALIKLHLAVEDRMLYAALQNSANAGLVQLGQRFQQEMGSIANAYMGFAQRWNTAEAVRSDEAGFKADANLVLRQLHERIQRENQDLYPRIAEMKAVAAH